MEKLGNTCAQCGAGATLFCRGCSGIRPDTNEEVRIWYCGKVCQTAGWNGHKDLCREIQAVKRLYRAARLLQSIFFATTREYTFGYDLQEVKKEDDKIKLYTKQIPSPFFFHKLPDLSSLSQENQRAVLSFLTCQQSVALICRLFPRVLSGSHIFHFLVTPSDYTPNANASR